MGGVNQTQRSALRRKLQDLFLKGTLAIANSIQTNEPNEKKFSKSWRSMLCLIGLRTTMSADIDSVSTALSLLKSTRIIPIHRQHTHQHHSLFRGGIKCLKNSQIAAGLDYVTNSELCRLLESEKGANEIINPWNQILPEDVGSCYEIVTEAKLIGTCGEHSIDSKSERRSSGVVHTPADLAQHMCASRENRS